MWIAVVYLYSNSPFRFIQVKSASSQIKIDLKSKKTEQMRIVSKAEDDDFNFGPGEFR